MCKYIAPNQTALQVHMGTHTDTKQQPTGKYKCETCERRYDTQDAMDIHILSHTSMRAMVLREAEAVQTLLSMNDT